VHVYFGLGGFMTKTPFINLEKIVLLKTAQRVQVLKMLKINMLSVFGDYVIFTIDELTKTSKPGKSLQKVRIDT
jgi:hypothetical protein